MAMVKRRRAPRRITITVQGSRADHGDVRLQDFIRQLEVVRNALKQTERALTGSEGPSVYWRVVDLRHSSPATIVLQEVVQETGGDVDSLAHTPQVIDEFIKNLAHINRKAQLPDQENRDLSVLESYRDLAVTDRHIERLTIQSGRRRVSISEKFRQNVERIIGPDELVEGSVSGVLEAVNLHNTLRFNIYPLVGPKKVSCSFDVDQKPTVLRAIDQYVSVSGTLFYKQWSDFPHAINVSEIDVFPSDDELPRLRDIRGMAPDATGPMTSEDFIQAARHGNW